MHTHSNTAEDLDRQWIDNVEVVPFPRAATPEPVFPVSHPPIRETGNTETERDLYTDIAALLDGTIPEPPAPEILQRSDGHALFYTGQVNLVFGDPESGKTWVALAAGAEVLS
ncbi:hypothetical protein BJD99_01040 [Rhodococcus sp. 1163]|uniref:hypothetical protein n=1 Tax=Rhodococcus sp. 1163 TaxID=1905289 RepID=UPI0009FEB4C5|nr:hypothetical protein [Rhodococcus sp. 1163]ORI11757.1 hypothetical protein BJD99_01040 [Rhodococcus sp. 1163]